MTHVQSYHRLGSQCRCDGERLGDAWRAIALDAQNLGLPIKPAGSCGDRWSGRGTAITPASRDAYAASSE